MVPTADPGPGVNNQLSWSTGGRSIGGHCTHFSILANGGDAPSGSGGENCFLKPLTLSPYDLDDANDADNADDDAVRAWLRGPLPEVELSIAYHSMYFSSLNYWRVLQCVKLFCPISILKVWLTQRR